VVEVGVPSYCQNRAMYFDPEKRALLAEIQPRKNQERFCHGFYTPQGAERWREFQERL